MPPPPPVTLEEVAFAFEIVVVVSEGDCSCCCSSRDESFEPRRFPVVLFLPSTMIAEVIILREDRLGHARSRIF